MGGHFLKSVYDASIEKDRLDILERWDYARNDDPRIIAHTSHTNIYLKCPCGRHESTAFTAIGIFHKMRRHDRNQQCPKCNSFAQWGIDTLGDDFLEKYWDYEKNTENPWVLQRRSNKKIWIKCNNVDYHPSYDTDCAKFYAGQRCSYCRGYRTVPEDSLASKHPEVIDVWSCKNTISAFEVPPSSRKEVWWKCPDGKHDDYCRSVKRSKKLEFRCPECSTNKLISSYQRKAAQELNKYEYLVLHEEKCTLNPRNPVTGHKMRYDNELPEIRLIVEVHGMQHYRKDKYFAASLSEEEQETRFINAKQRDRDKKEYAIAHGYTYLELPYKSFDDGTYVRRIMYAIKTAEKAVSP